MSSRERTTERNASGTYDRAPFYAGYLRIIAAQLRDKRADSEALALEAEALAEEFESWKIDPGTDVRADSVKRYMAVRIACRERGLDT